VEAVVPVGPLAAGELRALFTGEEDESVVGELGVIEKGEEFSHLGIHVSDFGEIGRKSLSSERGVGQVRRKLELGGWVGRGIAHDPGGVGFGESDDEAEGLVGFSCDELFGP